LKSPLASKNSVQEEQQYRNNGIEKTPSPRPSGNPPSAPPPKPNRTSELVSNTTSQLESLGLIGEAKLIDNAEDIPTISGAGNEIRTHDFNLGKVALYR